MNTRNLDTTKVGLTILEPNLRLFTHILIIFIQKKLDFSHFLRKNPPQPATRQAGPPTHLNAPPAYAWTLLGIFRALAASYTRS